MLTRMKANSDKKWLTGNWFRTATALLGEEFSEAVGAVRLLVARRELLAGEHLVAFRAGETFAVPRGVLVRYSALLDHLHTARRTKLVHFLGKFALQICL